MDDMPFKDKTDEELGDIVLSDKGGRFRLLPDEKESVVSTGDKTFRDKRARVDYVSVIQREFERIQSWVLLSRLCWNHGGRRLRRTSGHENDFRSGLE